jgi:hypothetical protein
MDLICNLLSMKSVAFSPLRGLSIGPVLGFDVWTLCLS